MNDVLAYLPNNWQLSRVDRVASVRARIGWKALTADEYQPDGYIFLSTPNIKGDQIDFDDVNYISELRYEESPELKLAVGDVLLAKDGNTLGITNLVRDLPRPATVNGSIAVLRPFAIHPGFLRHVLASKPSQELMGAMKGGMGVPHLFQWDIRRLPIPLPPLEDQIRITAFLDASTARIDALITKQRRMIELMLARREAICSDAVTGKL
jgi:type I restriction enzyme S subunit